MVPFSIIFVGEFCVTIYTLCYLNCFPVMKHLRLQVEHFR